MISIKPDENTTEMRSFMRNFSSHEPAFLKVILDEKQTFWFLNSSFSNKALISLHCNCFNGSLLH